MTVYNVDNNDRNADWVKVLTWDLPTDPDFYTSEQLDNLATLPAWQAAPQALKDKQAQGEAN
jgi:hypothetical protein